MLPITSPFDTYRAGFWAIRKNLRLAGIYVAAMTAVNLLLAAAGVGTGALLSLVLFVPLLLISAMLVYPLHATFLSDGRITGFAAIESFGRLARIAWRLFVIFFMAVLPAVIVIVSAALLLFSGVTGQDAMGGGLEMVASIIALFFSGISVILFGLLIPDIVAKNDDKPGPSSFQMGTRHFWRMAANLAAGPGIVLIGLEALRWVALPSPLAMASSIATNPATVLSDFVGVCGAILCSAMTAGVLSDAYRRVMAEDGKS